MPREYRQGTCSYCQKEGSIKAKGLCIACYSRLRKRGRLEKTKKRNFCKVEGCETHVVAWGMCEKHYLRWKKHGDVNQGFPEKWGQAEKHPLYKLWCGMRRRCNDPKSKGYKNYGGRGITVCARWNDFWSFVDDMGERPSPSHSIDREDTNGNYDPGNCRWATPKQQGQNKRSVVLTQEIANEIRRRLEFGDSVSAISRALGIPYDNVYNVKTKNIW